MSLLDAIEKGKQSYLDARKKEFEKRKDRPITPSGLNQFFNDLYYLNELGRPPTMTAENRKKLPGFIKLLKNNDYEDREIYDFVEQIFENWDKFKDMDFYTSKNRKKYVLNSMPDLTDIIFCRDQFLREVTKEDNQEDDTTVDLLEIWENEA